MGTGTNARRVISRTVAALIALWTGYFLCHNRQTLNPTQLALLGVSVVVGYGGVLWALGMRGNRLIGMGAAVVSVAAAGAAAPGNPLPAAPAAVLCLAACWQARAHGAMWRQFLAGFLFAGASVLMGLLTSWPILPASAGYGAALAVYVGLAESVGASRPVSKSQFAMVMAALVGGLLIGGSVNMWRPYGKVAAALLLWLAVRVGWYGSHVLKNCDSRRVEAFSESAVAGVGILAAALLVLQLPEQREKAGELTWPLIALASSVVLIRLAPYIGRRRVDSSEE